METLTRRIVMMIGELQVQRERQHRELASIQESEPTETNNRKERMLQRSIERVEGAIRSLAQLQLGDIED